MVSPQLLIKISSRKILKRVSISKRRLAEDILVGVPTNTPFVDGLAASSAGGAFGIFIYGVIENKEKISVLAKNFALSSSSGVAIGLIIDSMPFLAIGLASILSIMGVKDVISNKLIKMGDKVKIVAEVIGKNATTIGISVGGGIVGQMMIPIPLLGSFIGAAVAGFTGSAIIGVYDILTTKKIEFEVFALYCILSTFQRGKWVETPKNYVYFEKDELSIISRFCALCSMLKELDVGNIEKSLSRKKKNLDKFLQEIYSKIAPKEIRANKVGNNYENEVIYKTAICFTTLSLFYYYISIRYAKMMQEEGFPEEIFCSIISKFMELAEPEITIDFLSQRLELLGNKNSYVKIICYLEEKMKHRKIVNKMAKVLNSGSNKKEGSKKKRSFE